MKIQIYLVVIFMLLTICKLNAQTTGNWTESSVSVNGMYIWKVYPKNKVVELLGTPKTYRDSLYSEPIEAYVQECCFEDNSQFGFEEYRLTDFTLFSSKFKINGLVGVGDKVDKLKNLTGGGALQLETLDDGTSYYWYPIFPNSETGIKFYFDSNNTITTILFETID